MGRSLFTLVIRRLLLALPVLWGVTFVTFIFIWLAPQSPAIVRGDTLDEDEIAQLEKSMGVDRPFFEQYFDWMGLDFLLSGSAYTEGGVLTGNLGTSLMRGQDVTTIVFQRALVSVELAIWGTLWMIVLATSLGLISAFHRNKLPDHFARVYAVLGISVPDFVVGIFLIMLLGGTLFPAGGWVSWGDGVIPHLKHVVLPSFTVGFLITGLITRLFRSDLLDTMNNEHVNLAKAMGLPRYQIIRHDIIKPAIIPTITSAGMAISTLMGGLVLTEIVFTIPGLGRLAVNSVFSGDFPIIQGVVLLTATVFVLTNLLVDILYYYLDPRIRELEG
ncbi:ABC transporter permease [Natrialbaceae archaeon A-CW1-1]